MSNVDETLQGKNVCQARSLQNMIEEAVYLVGREGMMDGLSHPDVSLDRLERIAGANRRSTIKSIAPPVIPGFFPGTIRLENGYMPGLNGCPIPNAGSSGHDLSHRKLPGVISIAPAEELSCRLNDFIDEVKRNYVDTDTHWSSLRPIFDIRVRPFLAKGGRLPAIVWAVPFVVAWTGPKLPSVEAPEPFLAAFEKGTSDVSCLKDGIEQWLEGPELLPQLLDRVSFASQNELGNDGLLTFVRRVKTTPTLLQPDYLTIEHSFCYCGDFGRLVDPFDSLNAYRFRLGEYVITATWVIDAFVFSGEPVIDYLQVWVDPVTQGLHRCTLVSMNYELFWPVMFPLIGAIDEYSLEQVEGSRQG